MTLSLKNSRQPITLIEAARNCQTHLKRLGQYAQKSKAEHYTSASKVLLEGVVRDTSGSIGSLETWITEIGKGRQTSDDNIINTVNGYFAQLEDGIKAAEVALDPRPRSRLLKLSSVLHITRLVLGPECCYDPLAKLLQGEKQPCSWWKL